MGAIRFYGEKWPVAFWVFDGVQTDEDIDFYLSKLDEIHAKRQRFVTVSVMKKYRTNRQHLARIAAWIKENDELTHSLNLASAMISTSAVFRFVLSSLFLIQPLRIPYLVCGSLEEAYAYVTKQMRAAGLPVPAGLSGFNPEPAR